MLRKRLWIDIVTDPDVLFFQPIIQALTHQGHEVLVTSRTTGNLTSLAHTYGLDALFIDSFYGHSRMTKAASTLCRAYQLMVWATGMSIDISFSFCSRSQAIASAALRIPSTTTYDYEHVESRTANTLCNKLILPEIIPIEHYLDNGATREKIVSYRGLKEEVYAADFTPDDSIYTRLGVNPSQIIVTLRSSSIYTHYSAHNVPPLDDALVRWLLDKDHTVVIVIPRYKEQLKKYRSMAAVHPNLILVSQPENGQNLIWHSDLVISGGGSMIREAVVLGVPAYDMFSGRTGIIESDLIKNGHVTKILTPDDFQNISISKRVVSGHPPIDRRLRDFFVTHILNPAIL